jgi:hypothetical protein
MRMAKDRCHATIARLVELLDRGAEPEAIGPARAVDFQLIARAREKRTKRPSDPARSVVCLKIMDSLDTATVGSFKLIHRPEDA